MDVDVHFCSRNNFIIWEFASLIQTIQGAAALYLIYAYVCNNINGTFCQNFSKNCRPIKNINF